jgi:hypothetical protein
VNPPIFGHEYIDGDGTTDGYLHVEYLKSNQTSYLDSGIIQGAFVPRGLKNPVSAEYVVRALNVNPNRQIGVSNNSAAASVPTDELNVSAQTQTTVSNVSFANGKVEFDQTITNLGAGLFDGTIYTPVEFRIKSISNPTVTVANADSCGTGQPGSPASFFYREKLTAGQTSAPRRLAFNAPNQQLFVVDAIITARVQGASGAGTRYQPEPETNFACFESRTFQETFTGIVPAMDAGLQLIPGVTFVDVPFTSQEGAFGIVGEMTSSLGLDIDLELLDSAGRVLNSSLSGSANERVAAPIEPNRNYVYRVIGSAGVAQDFSIQSTQHLVVHQTSTVGTGGGGGGGVIPPPPGGTVISLLRFTVNPLTRTVTVQLLH